MKLLHGKIKEGQKDLNLQLPACMMAYRGLVHESTGVTPNLLTLGSELEVFLDAITEAPDLARRYLNKAAIRQKRNYDKRLAGRPFILLVILFGCTMFRERMGGRNIKVDCPWEGPYPVISVLSYVM